MISSSTGPVELKVMINGRQATEYTKDNQTFVEGRKGSKFSLKLTNRTAKRIHVVISVDGISINSGEPASHNDNGYVLSAYQTIDIPGWMLNSSEVAAFQFSSKKKSYAQQGSGDSTNCGVIGVAVWSEKVREAPLFTKGNLYSNLRGMTYDSYSATSANQIGSLNNLGTEFGQRTDFSTTTVSFLNDALIDQMALYYDDIKGLKARGIEVKKPLTSVLTTPNPFPGGCTPPANWKG